MPRTLLILTIMTTLGLLWLPSAGRVVADETELTEAYLNDPAHIEHGQKLFKQQCSRCHGKGAYPGKAPKLKPKRLSAEDVYLRITYGFRKMPPWEDVFSDQELMAVTAYVKSPIFSN